MQLAFYIIATARKYKRLTSNQLNMNIEKTFKVCERAWKCSHLYTFQTPISFNVWVGTYEFCLHVCRLLCYIMQGRRNRGGGGQGGKCPPNFRTPQKCPFFLSKQCPFKVKHAHFWLRKGAFSSIFKSLTANFCPWHTREGTKCGKGAPYGIYPVTFGPLYSDGGTGKLTPWTFLIAPHSQGRWNQGVGGACTPKISNTPKLPLFLSGKCPFFLSKKCPFKVIHAPFLLRKRAFSSMFKSLNAIYAPNGHAQLL